jgi:thiamine-monophosphate kinase
MDEFSIIKNYLSPLTNKNDGSFKLNDDIFIDKNKKIAFSVDTYVEKIHFMYSNKPKLFIKKIFRSALSDLICKGVVPKNYFLSCGLNKKSLNKKWLYQIKSILKSEQKKFGATLSGGDTVYSSKFFISFFVFGYYSSIPVLRNGAKINDDVYVTGNIGDSYIGLNIMKKKLNFGKLNSYFKRKYIEPELPIKFSRYLCDLASSSIDISDGFAQDLSHICDNSRCGAYVYLDNLPISSKCKILVDKKKIYLKKIFSRGDDYQILFTSNFKNRSKIKKLSMKTKTKITMIGRITKGKNIVFEHKTKVFNLNSKKMGYIHSF